MRTIVTIVTLLIVARVSCAQERIDSLQQKPSLPREWPDSLKTVWLRVDSAGKDFNLSVDSLTKRYNKSLGTVDLQINRLRYRIDTLRSQNFAYGSITSKLDSLQQKRKRIEDDFSKNLSTLKSKTIGRLDEIHVTPEMKGPLEQFKQKINSLEITKSDVLKLPAFDIPGYPKFNVEALSDISSKLGPALNIADVQKIEGIENLSGLTGELSGLQGNLTQGSDLNFQQLDKTIDTQVAEGFGLQDLQSQPEIPNGLGGQLTDLNNPEALRKQAEAIVKEEIINHFAGKEEELKSAIGTISKYKQKFASTKSIMDLPKRAPNPMKAKPFIERLVPGVYFQFQKQGAYLLDINPYAGYKIDRRFTVGLGWNQRVAYNEKLHSWISPKRIFGPRSFLDFKMGRGFIAHFEVEVMNTFVQNKLNVNPDLSERDWIWCTMLGLKKQYKIYKKLNGTILIQYNLFNPDYAAPYVDRLNSRIGLEYKFSKRHRKKN